MRTVKNPILAQLLMQLKFAPPKQRLKQLQAAERLFPLIEPDKRYPFEFVCFHITGYRPKSEIAQEMMAGKEVRRDLQAFIVKLSNQLAMPITAQKQPVYTIEELARRFAVSTRTVDRWRNRGLLGRKYILKNGKKHFGFTQSAVDEFLRQNPDLIKKAGRFTRLTEKEKKSIIAEARKLAENTSLSRRRITEQLAAGFNRSIETIRYTLIAYEQTNTRQRIFKKPSGTITQKRAGELYRMYRTGVPIKKLMEKCHRSRSSVYRIINQRRARELRNMKIEYIHSDEFLEPDAKEKILAEPAKAKTTKISKHLSSLEPVKDSLPQYLEAIKNTPLLTRPIEYELFRRYNYLKYLASTEAAKINPLRPKSTRLKNFEQYLARAEEVKKTIIEANLRLVVSIGKKHISGRASLLDLISEGNLSLMRAVEKFDFTRGYRFSTYASWVVAKDYAKKLPAEAARLDKPGAVELADIQQDMRTADTAGVVEIERMHQSLVELIKHNLDQREQHIILNHFGLVGKSFKKNYKTLRQIGSELGLSKERVRQIELAALQKLKRSLSTEEFDLLTGQ
jgi:RNA polymerase sigma factor (sigma-70 family)